MAGSHAANDLIFVREGGGYKVSSMQAPRPSCLVLVNRASKNTCRIEFDQPIPVQALNSQAFKQLRGIVEVGLASNRKCLSVSFKGERSDGMVRKIVSACFNGYK